jgi:hypothetical protein
LKLSESGLFIPTRSPRLVDQRKFRHGDLENAVLYLTNSQITSPCSHAGSVRSGQRCVQQPGLSKNLKFALAVFYNAELITFGFNELGQFAALVTGIGEYRFNLIVGNIGLNPPSRRAAARWSDMLAASTRLAIGMPNIFAKMCRFLPMTRL